MVGTAILRHGLEIAKRVGQAQQKLHKETDFSLELFPDGNKIYGVHAELIWLLPSRLGLMQNEFRGKMDIILNDPRAPQWMGGESYYKDTGLRVFCVSDIMKRLYERQEVVPAVQATAKSKTTHLLLWKIQLEGVVVFDAGQGYYTMKYLSGRTLAGLSKPIALSSDPLETALHHYFSR